jgi:hypothetical protein
MAENFKVHAKSCFTSFANNSFDHDNYRKVSESYSSYIEPVIKLSDNTAMVVRESVGVYKPNKSFHNSINIGESASRLK